MVCYLHSFSTHRAKGKPKQEITGHSFAAFKSSVLAHAKDSRFHELKLVMKPSRQLSKAQVTELTQALVDFGTKKATKKYINVDGNTKIFLTDYDFDCSVKKATGAAKKKTTKKLTPAEKKALRERAREAIFGPEGGGNEEDAEEEEAEWVSPPGITTADSTKGSPVCGPLTQLWQSRLPSTQSWTT